MNIVTLDFETFFSREFTLRKLTTEAYIRDPRFEVHGAALKREPGKRAEWFDRHLGYELARIDWSNTALVCHHAHFDAFILAHHFHIKPAIIFDTLAMARLLLGNHISVSLDSVRAQFGLHPKTTPYHLFEGRHWSELDQFARSAIAEGCIDEVESIWDLFDRHMRPKFPSTQYRVVDILARMFTEPMLVGDTEFFGKVWTAEYQRKQALLDELGISEADLQSNNLFAELLLQRGEEPELKQGKNELIYAFARTDDYMETLLDHEDPEIALLAEARLAVKSTIQQSRACTFGYMSTRGPMAVYLRPYGARTTRPSGGDRSNFLNMRKADPDLPADDTNTSLKYGLRAPPGYKLGMVDASQIECRTLNWFAGQWDVVDTFARGDDPYVRVASEFFGREITKADKKERQLGKVVELQSGYGSGGPKIRATLKHKAGIEISDDEGMEARDAYRATHPAVCDLWRQGGRMISRLAGGAPCGWGPCTIANGRLWLPNGASLIYDTLRHDSELDSWVVDSRQGWQKLYGSKLVENVCQALAWVIVSDTMTRIHNAGFRILNVPYDELLIAIPDDGHADEALEWCRQEMKRTPEWAAKLPLDAEATMGDTYA